MPQPGVSRSPPPARGGPCSRDAASPSPSAGRAPSGQSLNTSVSQRPNGPGSDGSGKSAVIDRSASAVRRVRDSTASFVGRPSGTIGSPTRILILRPTPSQLVPLMASGMMGTPARSAK